MTEEILCMKIKTYLESEKVPKSCRVCRNNGVDRGVGWGVGGGGFEVATGGMVFNFRSWSSRTSLEGVSAQIM